MKFSWFHTLTLTLFLGACTAPPTQEQIDQLYSQHGYLEEVEGIKALQWVRHQNQTTFSMLKSDSRFKTIEQNTLKILDAKDRIAFVSFKNSVLYNFWKDAKNPRGLIRKTNFADYYPNTPKWQTVLDLDALAKKENENWVYKGSSTLRKDTRTLLYLSRGGGDATVVREFDLASMQFVPNGFKLKEGKSALAWVDKDTLIVGTTFDASSVTNSGYPRILRRWKRGTPLSKTKKLFEGQKTDMSVSPSVWEGPKENLTLVTRRMTFWTSQRFLVEGDALKEIPLPQDSFVSSTFNGKGIVGLRSDWAYQGVTYKAGSLVEVDIKKLIANEKTATTLVIEPTHRLTVEASSATQNHLFVKVLDNVRGRVLQFSKVGGKWNQQELALPKNGSVSLGSADKYGNNIFLTYEDFLTPTSLYLYDAGSKKLDKLTSLPARFDGDKYKVAQFEATSKDGTKIPYFMVSQKGINRDSKNPALLYGYGGFEISLLPRYLPKVESSWLKEGGVYVLSNIRGGGEFGPKWHQAALKENRQKAYDDFAAVAEDLIKRKITSPAHLGVQGGSNGGLLTGVLSTQRPELVNAALIQVPLLDMLRYHLLPPGDSWTGEYGNPDKDPKIRAAIAAYSPYHKVKPKVKYPKVFFMTSTKDDRVHPAHARKMAKRMEDLGHSFLYYENTEGGHGGSANNKQRAFWEALAYTYLWQQLK